MHTRRPPNVLWLMTDEQRRDSMGCYGSAWARTPNLDRLAAQGVVFEHAYTPSPVCQPARESILTGDYPSQTRVWTNLGTHQLERDYLTRRFIDAGYRSASFGKQHYSGSQQAFETEKNLVISDAVDCYGYADSYDEADYDVIKHPFGWVLGGRFPEPAAKKREYEVVDEAMAWLARGSDDQPFLLRLSFSAPHTPVVPPVPFDTLIGEAEIALPPEADSVPEGSLRWAHHGALSDALTADQIRKLRRYYYGEVAFVDQQFGRLLDWMRARGLLENTIVAYVSDHGTHLGDYGRVQKGTFFEPVVSVPYFYWYPDGIARGVRLEAPVETRTLLPTLLSLAGLAVPDTLAEDNLAPWLRRGTATTARPVFSEIAGGVNDTRYVMVREGDWKLSLEMDPQPSVGILVDLGHDPLERCNLFDSPGAADTQARLRMLLDEHLKATPPVYPNVRLVDLARLHQDGSVACPECHRTEQIRRVPRDANVYWAESLSEAYRCGHCGTRFGAAGPET